MAEPLAAGDFVYLPGPTNGFKDRVARKGHVVCAFYEPRFLGFCRYRIEKRHDYGEGGWLVETLEEGWMWRGRKAPFYEFGPTSTEIHGDTLVDNRQQPVEL